MSVSMATCAVIAVASLGAVVLCGCTDPDASKRALEDAGYVDIQTGGYAWLACSHDDNFATRFSATGPTGRHVAGVVCRGWLKSSTIRTD